MFSVIARIPFVLMIARCLGLALKDVQRPLCDDVKTVMT
jgi:hypothetical protein